MKAGDLAAEIYMRGGYEILRIHEFNGNCIGVVDITSDLWVTMSRDGQMRVSVSSLTGLLSSFPWRTCIDEIVADVTTALETEADNG